MSETVEVNYVFRGKGKPMEFKKDSEVITREDFNKVMEAEPLDSRVAAIKLSMMADKLLSERDEALKWKEALLEVAIEKCFLGVAQPIGEDLIERLKPIFRQAVMEKANRIFEEGK